MYELEPHKYRIKGVKFVHDQDERGLGGHLVTAGCEGDINVWDLHGIESYDAEAATPVPITATVVGRYKISGRITCLAIWNKSPAAAVAPEAGMTK
jgi:hypothetical protein